MNVDINPSWKPYLQTEFNKPYFKSLTDFVKTEYKNHKCFPKGTDIFNAFNHCSFEDTKVVIIGQDPYHGDGQANGLCFSVNDGIPHPPSLINIFKEIETDLGISYPKSGNTWLRALLTSYYLAIIQLASKFGMTCTRVSASDRQGTRPGSSPRSA